MPTGRASGAPDVLQEAQVEVITNEECGVYHDPVHDTHICAGRGVPNVCSVVLYFSQTCRLKQNSVTYIKVQVLN